VWGQNIKAATRRIENTDRNWFVALKVPSRGRYSASPKANNSKQAKMGEPTKLMSIQINWLRFRRAAMPAGSRM